ncbi:PCDGI protein, partial [Piaya cayana]|nr:PCDGI protein [Piaya cayana]
EAPVFEKPEYEAHVMENLPPGSPVLQVVATDRDLGEDPGRGGDFWGGCLS